MSKDKFSGKMLRRCGAILALGAAAAVPVADAGDGSGLAQAIAQTMAAMQEISQQTQAALGKILGQSGGSLGGALQQTLDSTGLVLAQLSPDYLDPTTGTTSSNGSISWQGETRTYVLIRPTVAVANAPAVLLLHANGMNPDGFANLTRAGRLAQQYGVYVYLPKSRGAAWNENPSSYNTTDDVGFLSALIDHAVADDGVDAQRVYVAGYSSGGFMAERMACQGSSKVAGFVSVAATMRDSLQSVCTPSHAMPAAFMNGTSDAIVPYKGEPTVASASAAVTFWASTNSCLPLTDMQTTALPQQVSDGTSVALTTFTACPSDAAAELYTINGGGHTWPGSLDGAWTIGLGRTTGNLDATIALWTFLSQYQLN
jgi:polyhydroxybutyrate depolymerase